MTPQDVYDEVRRRAEPLVEAFKNDLLVIDKEEITERWPYVPFVHITRECGTDLVMLPDHDHPSYPPPDEDAPYLFGRATREQMAKGKLQIVRFNRDPFNGPRLLWLHYTGRQVKEVTPEAAQKVVESYVESLLKRWRKKANV